MSIVVALIAQAALLLPDRDGRTAAFDLARLRSPRGCATGGGADIVVCGARDARRDRLRPLDDDRYAATAARAEIGIAGNVKGAAVMEGATVGGFRSNRMMLRLKMPF